MTTTDALTGDLFDDETREVIAGLFDPAERVTRVATTRLEGLSDNGIVRVLKFAAAEIAQLEAMQVRGAAVLARRRRDRADTAAEVALALCLTDSFAGAFVSAAESLTTRLPQTFALMEHGHLNLFRAMRVTDATDWLPDDAAARTADAVLAPRLRPKPGQAGKNATQVRKAAAYAAQQADPEGAKRRTDQAREDRKFTLTHQESGTATLAVDNAPVEKAIAAYGRVNRMAKTLKTKDEPRSMDQLRADVALDLLLLADGGGAEPRIEGLLYLSLDTYLGLNENPGQLAGHGPSPPPSPARSWPDPTPCCAASSPIPAPATSWTWAAPAIAPPRPSATLCRSATKPAAAPAAAARRKPANSTTPWTGNTADTPQSPTWPDSATATTPSKTAPAGTSTPPTPAPSTSPPPPE